MFLVNLASMHPRKIQSPLTEILETALRAKNLLGVFKIGVFEVKNSPQLLLERCFELISIYGWGHQNQDGKFLMPTLGFVLEHLNPQLAG